MIILHTEKKYPGWYIQGENIYFALMMISAGQNTEEELM